MDKGAIQDEALRVIQMMDAAAFEAFTSGEISGERYREMAGHIGAIQKLMINILYGHTENGNIS